MDNFSRESRKRLRPWLERKVNSGECPGLVWLDREQKIFRIPWRHFNNKDWVEKDSQIFLEWAKFTGKYKDGDPMEYPLWKTRLRCALRKIPEIQELKEHHNTEDPNYPFKVYQFVDAPVKKNSFDSEDSHSPASTTSVYGGSPQGRDFLDDLESPPHFLNKPYEAPGTRNLPTVVFDQMLSRGGTTNFNLPVKSESNFLQQGCSSTSTGDHVMSNVDIGNDKLMMPPGAYAGYNQDSNMNQVTSQALNFPGVSEASSGFMSFIGGQEEMSFVPEAMNTQEEGIKNSLPSDLKSLPSNDLCDISKIELPPSLPNQGATSFQNLGLITSQNIGQASVNSNGQAQPVMQIKIFYGCPKKDMTPGPLVTNGCRLHFGPPQHGLEHTLIQEQMVGPKHVDQIKMPDVQLFAGMDEEHAKMAEEILNGMERGLVLMVKDGDIYAERLCRTRVFVSDGEKQSVLLNRRANPLKIFDFNGSFKPAYNDHVSDPKKELPKPYFYLTFGQEIKSGHYNPMRKVLVHVLVIHKEAARLIHELPSSESSSFGPLFSSFDTLDKLYENFKSKVTI